MHLKTQYGNHTWQMSTAELKRCMGITNSTKWPDKGMPSTNIDGTLVRVLPKNVDGTRTHRALATCADCGKEVPAGRLHQHRTIHKPI